MITQISFSEVVPYKDDGAGIKIFLTLAHGGINTRTEAKVDTGAEVCLFSLELARQLELPLEQGLPIRLHTLTGTIEAFGHEVVLQTGQLKFYSTVYFAKAPGLPRNLLGRRGWLRNLKLGLVNYDNLLYLNAYDD